MVFVSVIIPTHNRPIELLNTLLHLKEQKYDNFEVIVVDNSNEPYKRVNKRIIEKFSEILTIRYIPISPTHPSVARNIGISHSCGDYIAFLDDDDWWLPDKLLAQLKRSEEGYNFIFTGFVKIDQKNRIMHYYCPRDDVIENPLNLLKRSNFIATSSVLVRKDFLERAGYFDESLPALEDYDLWLRIAEIEKRFAAVRNILTVVTQSRLSVSKNNFKQALALIRFIRKHKQIIGEEKSLSLLVKACEHLKIEGKNLSSNIYHLLHRNIASILLSVERIKHQQCRWKLLINSILCQLPFGDRLIESIWFLNDTSPLVIKKAFSLIVI